MCDKKNYPKPLPERPKVRRLILSDEIRNYSPAGLYSLPDSEASSATELDSCPCDQQNDDTGISSSLPWQGNPINEPLPQIVTGTCSPDCKGRQDLIPRISRDSNFGYQQNSSRNGKRVSIQEQGFETSDLIPSYSKPATTSMQGVPAARPSFDPSTAPCNSYCKSCNNPVLAAPIQDQTPDVVPDYSRPSTTGSVNQPAFDPRTAPKEPLPVIPTHTLTTDVIPDCCKPSILKPGPGPAFDSRTAPKEPCCESCKKPLPVVPTHNQTTDVIPDCCKPSILKPGPEPVFDPRTAPKEPCCESCKSSVLVAPKRNNECDDYCPHDTCGKDAFNNEGPSQESEDESEGPPKIKLWNMPLGTPPPRVRSKSATAVIGEQTDSDKPELDNKRLSKDGQSNPTTAENKRLSQDSSKRNSINEDVKKVPSKGLVKKRNSKN